MFRLSQYMQQLLEANPPPAPHRGVAMRHGDGRTFASGAAAQAAGHLPAASGGRTLGFPAGSAMQPQEAILCAAASEALARGTIQPLPLPDRQDQPAGPAADTRKGDLLKERSALAAAQAPALAGIHADEHGGPAEHPAFISEAAISRSAAIRPVVIWNLTRSCNLRCRHCYTTSADRPFPGELTHSQAMEVLDDLAGLRIPALILSGGEPLSRFDFWDLAQRARALNFRHLALSTNGTRLAEPAIADRVAALGFDYVGISLDGIGATNDWFRGTEGAFAAALAGVRACKARGVKVGLRFTLTRDNAGQLPAMLDLCEAEGVDKFYLSHLVYAGRGDKHRGEDAVHDHTRDALDLLIERAWGALCSGRPLEIVTGNNDADAVYFLRWAEGRFDPARIARLRARLTAWGGNSAGLGVANIDPQGRVHPDTYWSDYTVGSVKDVPFSALWTGDDPMLATLRTRPRPLKGRCGACAFRTVCGGNTRIRALQLTGDPWAEDPACYMTNAEIGIAGDRDRLTVAPFRGKSHDPAHQFF